MPPPPLGPPKDEIDAIWFEGMLPKDKPVLTEVLYAQGNLANRLKNYTMVVLFVQLMEIIISMALFFRRPSIFVLTINPIFAGVTIMSLVKLPKLELWVLRIHSRFTWAGAAIILVVATWEVIGGEGVTRFLLHLPLIVDILAAFWTNYVYWAIIDEGKRLEEEYGSENAALDAYRARAGNANSTYQPTSPIPVIEPTIPPTPRAPKDPQGVLTPPPPAYSAGDAVVGGGYLQALWTKITKVDDPGLAARAQGLQVLADELGEPLYGRTMLALRWTCRVKTLDRLSLVEWKHGMAILSFPTSKEALISALKPRARAAYSIKKASKGSEWSDFNGWLWYAVTGAPEISLAPLDTAALVWGQACTEMLWPDTSLWLEFISTPSALEGSAAWASQAVTRAEWDAIWEHALNKKSIAGRSSSDGSSLPLPLLLKAFGSWMKKQPSSNV